MKRTIIVSLSVLMMLVLLVPAVSASPASTPAQYTLHGVPAEVSAIPARPAHFIACGLNIETSVQKIWAPLTFVTNRGKTVTITANVFNDGYQQGTHEIAFKLNGQTVDTQTIALGAGQGTQVSFTQSGLAYGQYDVQVADLDGQFTASRTITWWLIAVIVVGLGLVIWRVIWGRRRRRAQQAQ
jgi:hypothetical protein